MADGKSRIELLKQYLAEEPQDDFSRYALALEYARQGNSSEAIALLQQVLSRNAEYLAAYYQLGKLHEQQGEREPATAAYTKGMEVAQRQKDTKTLNELRGALEMMGE